MHLTKEEKLIKEYPYAGAKSGLPFGKANMMENLIVTNQRIIHRVEKSGVGSKFVRQLEMPIKDVNNINVEYGVRSHIVALILAIIMFAASIVPLITNGMALLGILLIALGVGFLLIYLKKKVYRVSCTIYSSSRVHPVISTKKQSQGLITRIFGNGSDGYTKRFVRYYVSEEIAEAMVEEMGAVILNAAHGMYDRIDEND